MTDGQGPRPIRTFGRKGGRALSKRQQALMDDLYPKVAVPTAANGTLAPASLFENTPNVWLEIGFGGAEHMLAQAARAPDIGIIGCEPYSEGIAKALTGIAEDDLKNIRLHADDARDVMARLQPASIARTFILFPDPWPKKRQQKRRLIQTDFLEDLHRIMAPGGGVRFATDVASYADEALHRFLAQGGFDWQASRADDWRIPPADHITTRYETKKLGDCAPVFYDFVTV